MTGWELVQWITLALIPRLGRRTLERLLAHFGSLDAVLSADDAALKAVPRIGGKTAAAIRPRSRGAWAAAPAGRPAGARTSFRALGGRPALCRPR